MSGAFVRLRAVSLLSCRISVNPITLMSAIAPSGSLGIVSLVRRAAGGRMAISLAGCVAVYLRRRHTEPGEINAQSLTSRHLEERTLRIDFMYLEANAD